MSCGGPFYRTAYSSPNLLLSLHYIHISLRGRSAREGASSFFYYYINLQAFQDEKQKPPSMRFLIDIYHLRVYPIHTLKLQNRFARNLNVYSKFSIEPRAPI